MKMFPDRLPLAALITFAAAPLFAADPPAPPPPPVMCPLGVGWEEGLSNYLQPDAVFPTSDTANPPTPDCAFHQWSWEAFTWAIAIDPVAQVPRFLTLPTPDGLLTASAGAAKPGPRRLHLALRSLRSQDAAGFTEGPGAIVEADGNILIAPNGYPVYASVHMNPTYFATAQKNMITANPATGGYATQPPDSYFNVGDAVFKATWLRLESPITAPPTDAPAGAYTTLADVPVLQVLRTKNNYTVLPSGQTQTVWVALVGLHVVGYTVNHPEFLWATFEHNLNSPSTPDGQFAFSPTTSTSTSSTFYAGGTPYSQVNMPNPPLAGQTYTPPQLTFNPITQKFSPAHNVVLENATGGENQVNGPANVAAVNASAQHFYASLKGTNPNQAIFGNYHLIGTVWFLPNTYVLPTAVTANNGAGLNQVNGVGSFNLANTTAETFEQWPLGYPPTPASTTNQSCFLCHNAYSNTPPTGPSLTPRRIAISHVLEEGSPFAVPNLLSVPITH